MRSKVDSAAAPCAEAGVAAPAAIASARPAALPIMRRETIFISSCSRAGTFGTPAVLDARQCTPHAACG
jgi:hypothetical protein